MPTFLFPCPWETCWQTEGSMCAGMTGRADPCNAPPAHKASSRHLLLCDLQKTTTLHMSRFPTASLRLSASVDTNLITHQAGDCLHWQKRAFYLSNVMWRLFSPVINTFSVLQQSWNDLSMFLHKWCIWRVKENKGLAHLWPREAKQSAAAKRQQKAFDYTSACLLLYTKRFISHC